MYDFSGGVVAQEPPYPVQGQGQSNVQYEEAIKQWEKEEQTWLNKLPAEIRFVRTLFSRPPGTTSAADFKVSSHFIDDPKRFARNIAELISIVEFDSNSKSSKQRIQAIVEKIDNNQGHRKVLKKAITEINNSQDAPLPRDVLRYALLGALWSKCGSDRSALAAYYGELGMQLGKEIKFTEDTFVGQTNEIKKEVSGYLGKDLSNPENYEKVVWASLLPAGRPKDINYGLLQNPFSNGQDKEIPDCMETTVRNFVQHLAFDQRTGTFSVDVLQKLKGENALPLPESLVKFFSTYPDGASAVSSKAHNEWYKMMSAIPGMPPEGYNCDGKHELNPSYRNLIIVLNHIFGLGLFNQKAIKDPKFVSTYLPKVFEKIGTPVRLPADIDAKDAQAGVVPIDVKLDKLWDREPYMVTFNINHHLHSEFKSEEAQAVHIKALDEQADEQLKQGTSTTVFLLSEEGFKKYLEKEEDQKRLLFSLFGQQIDNPDNIVPLAQKIQKFDRHLLKFLLNCVNRHADSNVAAEQKIEIYGLALRKGVPEHEGLVEICQKNSPVIAAAMNVHNFKLARQLIDKGADVNAKGRNGNTPLNDALDLRDEGLARAIVDKGADVNAKDRYGDMPLHRALDLGDEELARAIINKGADVNAKDKIGNTPLHCAIAFNREKLARAIINKGADLDAENKRSETPLDTAKKFGREDLGWALFNIKNNLARFNEEEQARRTLIFRQQEGRDSKVSTEPEGAEEQIEELRGQNKGIARDNIEILNVRRKPSVVLPSQQQGRVFEVAEEEQKEPRKGMAYDDMEILNAQRKSSVVPTIKRSFEESDKDKPVVKSSLGLQKRKIKVK
ncbi:MAG: ankyrin repeat domain-containing protein [Candidatus Babeliales bacterium]